jgi:hypothetical protein
MPVASVPVAAAVVTFSTVISGSVSGFDEESYKERLAAVLAGVSTRDILLNVAAGSASVTARIGVASDAVANSTMHTLNTYTTGTLSAALGVQIQSIAPPTLVRIPRPDSIGVNGTRDEASLSTENQTPTEHIVLYVVLAVVLLLLAVAFAWCVGLCGGGRRAQQYDFGHKAEFSKGPTTFESMETTVGQLKSTSRTGGALERARTANAARTKETRNPFTDGATIDDEGDARL